MSPRTNWDPGRETEGTRSYRKRRTEALEHMGTRARRRGAESIERESGELREGEYYSPEERADQQDWQFAHGTEMQRDAALTRERRRRKSGATTFHTGEQAAEAMESYSRRRRK